MWIERHLVACPAVVLLLLGACAVEPSARDGANGDRGTWEPTGKADELATCQDACGTRAAGGCWCDELCAVYGDCCPDKVAICGGDGPDEGDVGDDGGGDDGGGDDGGGNDDGGNDNGGNDNGGNDGTKACFEGPNGTGDLCLFVTALPGGTTGYDYPAPYNGSANYRAPIAYLDLEAISGDTKIAASFRLDEIAQLYKGRYAVVQPHAVAALQDIRNQLGAIKVNSGYRNPKYNSSVGGATHSRHMYGDAFDIVATNASLSTLESACGQHGGKLVEYNSHVHCDWRYQDVDPVFFGAAASGTPGLEPDPAFALATFEAELVHVQGVWSAPAAGFDEGEPKRRWTALDPQGQTLATAVGDSFVPPPGTATVRVLVGAQVELEATVEVAP